MPTLSEIPHAHVNDLCWVQLNERGWKIYDESFTSLGLDPALGRAHLGLVWQKFQVWMLMEIFGPHIGLGMVSPFDGAIYFEDPTDAD